MATKKELQEQIDNLNLYTKELEDLCTMLANGYRDQLEAAFQSGCYPNCKSIQDVFNKDEIIKKLRAIE